jgi:hypothetical protein
MGRRRPSTVALKWLVCACKTVKHDPSRMARLRTPRYCNIGLSSVYVGRAQGSGRYLR